MVIELISWMYISLVCLIWGNLILKPLAKKEQKTQIPWPIACFAGMSCIGICCFYISIFIPLFPLLKIFVQLGSLLLLFKKNIRKEISMQIKVACTGFDRLTFFLLALSLFMVLLLTVSPVIHPDTLAYHSFSISIFDKFGAIPGIANVKPEYGFQSIWFAAVSFFNFSLPGIESFLPLNGCVALWFIIFIACEISSAFRDRPVVNFQVLIYLALLVFSIFSWTQIRLTASSYSPDFIATIGILLTFYLLAKKEGDQLDNFDFYAVFFAVVSVSLKLSAIVIVLVPLAIFIDSIRIRYWFKAFKVFFLSVFVIAPVLIHNLIASGYPLYPARTNLGFRTDWQVKDATLWITRNYISAYARYPVSRLETTRAVDESMLKWIPIWWKNLSLTDHILMLVLLLGIFASPICFTYIQKRYSTREIGLFLLSVAGTLFWFVNAPDPRFGTGFILPLIYFLYKPFIEIAFSGNLTVFSRVYRGVIKGMLALLIIYNCYRIFYFFNPREILLPDGISVTNSNRDDCEFRIKSMILDKTFTQSSLPDSCYHFSFRGSLIVQGFKPMN